LKNCESTLPVLAKNTRFTREKFARSTPYRADPFCRHTYSRKIRESTVVLTRVGSLFAGAFSIELNVIAFGDNRTVKNRTGPDIINASLSDSLIISTKTKGPILKGFASKLNANPFNNWYIHLIFMLRAIRSAYGLVQTPEELKIYILLPDKRTPFAAIDPSSKNQYHLPLIFFQPIAASPPDMK